MLSADEYHQFSVNQEEGEDERRETVILNHRKFLKFFPPKNEIK
jgi:hypothetical protein